MVELGQSPRRLRLRMCRRDIASLLGVAHETVSRSFTTLAESGFLKVDNREVELLDIARLQARARITRGPDDHGHSSSRQVSATRTTPMPMAWCPNALGHGAFTPGPISPR